MSQPDEQLIEGYLAGDDRCFAELIRRYQEPLLRLTRRITGDAATAEDAVQEVFMAAACSLESLERPERFRSWLFRIAYRKGTLLMNRTRRGPPMMSYSEHPELEPSSAAPRSTRHESPVRERLRRILRTLAGQDRALLDLRFIDGFTCADIARISGERPSSVRKRIWRLKRDLLDRLEGPEGIGA
jgi:RNA polymerase sigma-70 factor (ECF subfamily)